MARLWEFHHPYYCNEGNYFARGDEQPTMHYRSWAEFHEAEGDSDPDYNLLFRWDWETPRNEDGDEDPALLSPDPYYRDCRLLLFWVGQRKGLYRWTTIDVCQADEPGVRQWLWGRLDHLMKVWFPLTPGTNFPPIS